MLADFIAYEARKERGMNIIIVGVGNVGQELVGRLSDEGHNIVAVDTDAKKLENIIDNYDVKGILGNGASYEVLEEADAGSADLLIACTPHDEMNILCCMVGKKFNAKETIARIRTPEYFTLFQGKELGLSMMVNPEHETASDIASSLRFLSAIKIDTFADGKVNLAEIKITETDALNGTELKDLSSKFSTKVLICAVERAGKVHIPKGNFRLEAGDNVYFTASSQEIAGFFKETTGGKGTRSVMIVGGGMIAYYLAKELRRMGIRVKIIESNETRCRFLSENLNKVEIIHGDGTDQDILVDEGVTRTDAFIALCGFDEQNIILSMFARSKGVKKVIAKVDKMPYYKMLRSVGVESIVSTRATTADQIVRYVRGMQNTVGGKVNKLHRIVNDQAEALEFSVQSDFKALGMPLRSVKLGKNIIIATIIRNNEIIVPDGNSTIEEGDTVIVVTTREFTDDFNEILG